MLCLTAAGSLMVGVASSNQERVRVIIGFKETPDADLVKAHDGKIKYQYRIIPAIAGFLPEAAIDVLRQHRKVAYVELDSEVKAFGDTLGWGVDRIDAEIVWGGAEDATDAAVGRNAGDGVRVAIIDTGIDWNHPDLAANYHGGRDFVYDDDDPMDDHGHGTHCAGIVAAVDNDAGVIGVGPRIWLYGVKVLDSTGSGYVSDVVAGIDWAVANGMQIISMSLGSSSDDTSLRNACDNAYSKGLLLVAAAGNDGYWPWDTVSYPARYSSVIAVAATDQSDTRPSWSSRGPSVELAAPGVNVYSTVWDNSYATMSGTSMACPHVSGTAALVFKSPVDPAYDLDHDGFWDAAEVREKLKDTADDLGPAGRDDSYGWGLVDADEAAPPGGPPPNQPPVADAGPDRTGLVGEVLTFDGSGSNDPDGSIVSYEWVFGDGETGSGVAVDHAYSTAGTYKVTLSVMDDDGATGTDEAVAKISETPENLPPVADAGPDQTLSDADSSGSETVTLDGSGSGDPDGTIVSYEWTEDLHVLGTEAIITLDFEVGTHTVTLTVKDDDGATDSDDVVVTVNPNKPPVANAGPDQTGLVGQTLNFDGSGSYDLDGTIDSYEWNFGDGSTASGVTVTHSYSAAGTYTVTLAVTDNGGATATDTASVEIFVQPPQNYMYVESIAMSKEKLWYLKRAVAVVTILDTKGNPVAGATVHGYWSGRVSWEDSRVTNSNGKATFYTPWIIGKGGTCTFTVEDMQKNGLIYNPSLNKETSDSITI